jgi:tRNA(adenine34) deaminase
LFGNWLLEIDTLTFPDKFSLGEGRREKARSPEEDKARGSERFLHLDQSRANSGQHHDTGSDELWMEEALRSAQRALEADEVPVGAVVIHEDRVVGRGWNRNVTDHDPSGHAEIVALREAGQILGNHRLGDCELFATIEPCAMCAGAIIHARIRRLVYGADDPKAGAVRSVLAVINHPGLNHKMEIRGGVLASRSSEILQEFFRRRR